MAVSNKYPRSIWPLLVVLFISILAFVLLRGNDKDLNFTLGGMVFPVNSEDIMVMTLTMDNSEYRFERLETEGWTLSGDINDFLDSNAMAEMVAFLVAVQGGRVLAGTVPEDRRYGFDGNESIRLSLFATEGREFRLALGEENPVTGGVYASGVGRAGCFPVGQGLRNLLRTLPATVQEDQLLPPFNVDALTEIDVWRGAEKLTLQLDDSRWWIEEPEDGMAQLGISFRRYSEVYTDRRRVVNGQPWLLADPPAVEKLIYESSQVMVREIVQPLEKPEKMEEWSMRPAWRKVVFHGAGINNDYSAGSSDEFTISYGPSLDNGYVPLLRRNNLMLGDIMAVETLTWPLGQLLDTGAMPFRVEVGDSLHMDLDGRWMVSAYPGDDEDISRWVGELNLFNDTTVNEKSRRNIIENLIVNMDRLEIIQVLPSSENGRVLQDSERVHLDFWTSKEGSRAKREVEFGWLDLDNLPGGDVTKATNLALEKDGQLPAGMWVPATGKFLQIPAHLIISFRNLQ